MIKRHNHTFTGIVPKVPPEIPLNITQYNDLLIAVEILLINHALLDRNHYEDINKYKFMTPELVLLKDELSDRYRNNEQPVIQALIDKYPTLYGKLEAKAHSSIRSALNSAKTLKARLHTYNKLTACRGLVSGSGKPLKGTIDDLIRDMERVRRALDG